MTSTEQNETNFVDDDDLRKLSDVIDSILLTSACMIKDFHFDTRCGDIMMDHFDYHIGEVRDHANKLGISGEYKDYESTDKFIEWITLSKNSDRELRLKKAIKLLSTVLNDISISDKNTQMCSEMYGNLILLHAIMGTLDLYYNKIDNILDVLSDRQIKLVKNQSLSRLP